MSVCLFFLSLGIEADIEIEVVWFLSVQNLLKKVDKILHKIKGFVCNAMRNNFCFGKDYNSLIVTSIKRGTPK